VRYKEREKLHRTETCAKSRSRDSVAESLGVVKAKMNNMGQKYNTDTLLAASRLEIVRGLAIVSGRHAAEGGTGGGGWEGTLAFAAWLDSHIFPYLVITHSHAWHQRSGPNCTLYFIFLSSAHTHTTRRDKARREGQNQLPGPNRSPREQPKKKQCKR